MGQRKLRHRPVDLYENKFYGILDNFIGNSRWTWVSDLFCARRFRQRGRTALCGGPTARQFVPEPVTLPAQSLYFSEIEKSQKTTSHRVGDVTR